MASDAEGGGSVKDLAKKFEGEENPAADDGGDDAGTGPTAADLEEPMGTLIVRSFFLFLVQLVMTVAFGTIFTELGKGATIFKFLGRHHEYYAPTSSATFGLIFILYMVDFRFWAHGAISSFVGFVLSCGVVLTCVFAFRNNPHYPLAIFYVMNPLVYMFFHYYVFVKAHLSNFMRSMSVALAMNGLLGLAVTGAFNSKHDFWWGEDTQIQFRARVRVCDMDMTHPYASLADAKANLTAFNLTTADAGTSIGSAYCITYDTNGEACFCPPEFEITEDSVCDDPDEPHCLAVFMLWASPAMGSVMMLLLGIISGLLSRTIREVQVEHDAVTDHVHTGTKIFAYIMVIGILGVYVSASIAGASMKVASLVTTFSFLTVAMCVLFIGISVGWRSLGDEMHEIPIVRKLEDARHSDLLKAIAVLVLGGPALFYFFLSFINQVFRKVFPCTKDLDEEEAKLSLTQVGSNLFHTLKGWNWSAILSKMVWVGLFYFIFSVGVGKLVTLGLSLLNDALDGMSLGLVTAIYFVVGCSMFLLPPVPGIPVYLMGGILLAKNAEETFGSVEEPNFVLGMIYASFWACLCKAAAILGQQKGIGGLLGGKVAIRKAVGVNSLTIRAIKKMLQQPGITKGKVAVLVGGPDWPTSVLTGILGLSYSQMIIGSVPFVITIPATVLAGALQLKTAEGPAMAAAASTMLFVASLFQGGCLIWALVQIEETSTLYKEELMAEPLDEEVDKLEKEAERAQANYDAATKWSTTPAHIKVLMLLNALLMTVSLYMMAGAGPSCFKSLELIPQNATLGPVDGPPLNGDVASLVMPLGRYAIAIHFAAIFLHVAVYGTWASGQTKKYAAENNGGADSAADSAINMLSDQNGVTDEEAAAIKIQAIQRGNLSRKAAESNEMET
eukprot:SAG22_NODE_216_length_14937_cov_51.622995_10_plen_898_part_00